MAGQVAFADSATDIVDALVSKGVLTEEEGKLITKGHTSKTAVTPVVKEKDGAFTLESANGRNSVQLTGRMHFDYRHINIPGLADNTIPNYSDKDTASGADQFEKTIKCIEIGAEDYLPKPFDPILLRARIFSSLEKKRLRDLDKKHLEMLNQEKQLLEIEQMKTEKLMLNILPRPIADRLKRGEKNISGSYPDVTILFSDLVGFTKMSSTTTATELVKLLNDLFTRFDIRAEALGLEKIKTIGDAYMAVGGLPIPRPDHAALCAEMALGMFDDLKKFNQENNADLNMRIGMNSGPVVAGVIGFTKFSYDLWGNTVNTASRMESTSQHGRVQVSPSTYEALKDAYDFEDAGLMECKGLGEIRTHLLVGKKG
jgi:class 3 adenylate cyclase